MAKRIKQGSSDRPHTGDGKPADPKPMGGAMKFEGKVGKATGQAKVPTGRVSRLRTIADIVTGKHRK